MEESSGAQVPGVGSVYSITQVVPADPQNDMQRARVARFRLTSKRERTSWMSCGRTVMLGSVMQRTKSCVPSPMGLVTLQKFQKDFVTYLVFLSPRSTFSVSEKGERLCQFQVDAELNVVRKGGFPDVVTAVSSDTRCPSTL